MDSRYTKSYQRDTNSQSSRASSYHSRDLTRQWATRSTEWQASDAAGQRVPSSGYDRLYSTYTAAGPSNTPDYAAIREIIKQRDGKTSGEIPLGHHPDLYPGKGGSGGESSGTKKQIEGPLKYLTSDEHILVNSCLSKHKDKRTMKEALALELYRTAHDMFIQDKEDKKEQEIKNALRKIRNEMSKWG